MQLVCIMQAAQYAQTKATTYTEHSQLFVDTCTYTVMLLTSSVEGIARKVMLL